MPTPNLRIINPFNPHPWQYAPLRSQAFILLLTGSAGGGKSRLAGEKVHMFMNYYSGAMGLMLRKVRESMTNSTVLFYDRTVVGDDPHVRHLSSKHRFEYDNGSLLAYGGMADDKQREQIRSIGKDGSLDIVWLEEANRFTENDFNELIARMRGKAAPWVQIVLTTNPDAPTHWIYQRLIKGGEADIYFSGAADNPTNPAHYQQILGRLTGVLFLRLVKGLWVKGEGLVYEDWNPEKHLIDPFPIPREWRRWRVIDFGYTNPFVCQWWAEDGDGRLYLYREIYMSGRLVEDHARQIAKLSANEVIYETVADHDAEDRATLERYGIITTPATKDVSPGIQAVQSRLRIAGDDRPRLMIMRGALVEVDDKLAAAKKPTCTEDEIVIYAYPKGIDGKPNKENPIKNDDHGMDGMRYLVARVDGLPENVAYTGNASVVDVVRRAGQVKDSFGMSTSFNTFLAGKDKKRK